MNRIILIGNGFDLAHGLKTRYEDFINWYWDQRVKGFVGNLTDTSKDILCTFRDLTGQVWNVNAFNGLRVGYNGLKVGYNSGTDIIQFIRDRKDYFETTITPFFKNICTSIETKGWVDIENEYYTLLTRVAIKDTSGKELLDLNTQLSYLQEKLIEYLKLISNKEVKIIDCVEKHIYSSIKTREIAISSINRIDPNSRSNGEIKFDRVLFLNFNYTKTPELYLHSNRINYIHGIVEKPTSVIFGYGDELDDNYIKLKKLNDNECLRNMKTIKYLETDNYRNALAFMDSAPFQVCIMGHSCGNSDRTLLNTLFEHNNCRSIKPYYYKKDDGTDNYIELIQNISRNFTDMKLMRDRVVNKMYCEPLVSND